MYQEQVPQGKDPDRISPCELADRMPAGAAILRYQGAEERQLVLEYGNQALLGMLGRNETAPCPEETLKRFDSLVYDRDRIFLFQKIEQAPDQSIISVRFRLLRQPAAGTWCRMEAAVEKREDYTLLYCAVLDISEQETTFEKLAMIADMSADRIFEYDIVRDEMVYYRQDREKLLYTSRKQGYQDHIFDSNYVAEEFLTPFKRFCRQMREGKKEIYLELKRMYEDGRYHWTEIAGRTVFDSSGRPLKVIGRSQMVDDRKRQEEELKALSERDSLTGLYNHRTLKRHVREQMENFGGEKTACLMVCDVDDFKKVNDTKGHLFGDGVLCAFAQGLQTQFKGSIIGRIGGDEFVVFTIRMTKEDMAERFRGFNRMMRQMYTLEENGIQITSSAGIAAFEHSAPAYEEVFARADKTLYYVKNHGKGDVCFYTRKIGEAPIVRKAAVKNDPGESVRREAVIKKADDLVLYALELFDKSPDIRSAVKLVSDRICSFYDLDEILVLDEDNEREGIGIQYLSTQLHAEEGDMEPKSSGFEKSLWEYMHAPRQEKEELFLSPADLKKLGIKGVGACMACLVRQEQCSGMVLFLDRIQRKNRTGEQGTLKRLARLLYKHVQRDGELSEVELLTKKFEIALRHADMSYWEWDIRTKRLYRSKAVWSAVGYNEFVENVPDCFISAGVIDDEYVQEYLEFYHKLERGENASLKFRGTFEDGKKGWLSISYEVLKDKRGIPLKAIGVGSVTAE